MIIVEGYDCSGKSTLVKKLRHTTGFNAPHSGGPPRDLSHARRCLARCAMRMTQQVIQDRVSQVSAAVYQMLTKPDIASLALSRMDDLRLARLLIYCRPATATILARLSDHRPKAEYDTPEHIAYVVSQAETMIRLYDTVIEMARRYVDVFVYDYEDLKDDLKLQPIIEELIS